MSKAVKITCSLVAAVALAIVVTACGSSKSKTTAVKTSSTTSSAATSSAVSKPSGPVANEPESVVKESEEAGVKAAEKEGAPVKVPTETLGLVDITAESEAADRIEQGAVEAAKAMGWKITTVDAEGNPAKSESAMMGFVNEKVSAIIDLSNSTSSITPALAAARAANIPVINIGGTQESSPNIEAQFTPNEAELTEKLDEYMLAHVKKGAKVATFVFPLLLSERTRDEVFDKQVKPHVDVVASHTSNFAALVSDTQNAARTILAANPGLEAFWGDTDTQMPAIAQVLKSKGLCGKVQNYNFYDDKANLAAIREGCATAVVTSPLGADGWAATDSLAEMFARKKTINELPKGWEELEKGVYGIQIRNGSAIQVLDKSNLPPEGQYATPKVDYVAFFEAKWKKEFGI